LGAGVLVSSVATATGPCSKKLCAEEIAAGCGGLKAMALSTCSKAVLLHCDTTDCSCTDPTLPACGPTTTTTSSTTTTSTSTSTTTTQMGCGNGTIDPGESCDPPDFGTTCDASCQTIVCTTPTTCG